MREGLHTGMNSLRYGLYNLRLSDDEIAEIERKCSSTIADWRHTLKLDKIYEKEDKRINNSLLYGLWNLGYSDWEIGKIINKCHSTIHGWRTIRRLESNERVISKIELNCKECNELFLIFPSEFHHFCSRKCYNVWESKNTEGEDNPNWNGGKSVIKCKMCNNIFETYDESQMFCSSKCRYSYMIKDNHPSWIQDRNKLFSSKSKQLSNSYEWKQWRISVFERDDYICQECGNYNVELHPHHIKPKAEFPELIFELFNGITLCKECHMELHGLIKME